MLLARLFPHLTGLHICDVECADEQVAITVEAQHPRARCPLCHQGSARVHSHYQRRVADLPVSGRPVVLLVHVRRFVCGTPTCPRRVFTERLPRLVRPWGRRTEPLRETLTEVGFALGGEAGARLGLKVGLRTSPTSLLRLVRAAPTKAVGRPRIIGIDDYARKRGRTYGTLICDHEQGRTLALLPDRSADTVAAWLARHPSVQVITRDRGAGYIEGATRGAPQAIQVADRWHLLKNMGEAVVRVLLTEQRRWRRALRPPVVPLPAQEVPIVRPRTAAQREQAARLAARVARFEEVRQLAAHGYSLRTVAQMTGLCRDTVRAYVHADAPPVVQQRAPRPRLLDAYAAYLQQRWQEGCHNATVLFTEVCDQGYAGSYVSCATYVRTLRQAAQAALPCAVRTPEADLSPRQAAWLFVAPPTDLEETERSLLVRLREASPALSTTYALVQAFTSMVRQREGDRLDTWFAAVEASGVAALRGFAANLRQDDAAVRAALTLPYSQGRSEGLVGKLKLLKRLMFGRAKHDLLEKRVVGRR